MPGQPIIPTQKQSAIPSREIWLRKHADYQRVYREGKRQSLPLMTYFFALRELSLSRPSQNGEPRGTHQKQSSAGLRPDPRVGLTAGRVLGNAVERNRIKRRMRAAVRQHRAELSAGVDIILHPRRGVLEAEFAQIERDVLRAFRAVQASVRDKDSPHAR
jgi:ribonuclease P protein component